MDKLNMPTKKHINDFISCKREREREFLLMAIYFDPIRLQREIEKIQ